jgi:hypothetical protein
MEWFRPCPLCWVCHQGHHNAPNIFLVALLINIIWLRELESFIYFSFVIGIFDWPITKNNNKSFDSIKINIL